MDSPVLPLEISCHQVHTLRTSGRALALIDCREPHEHELVAIEGNQLIPMSEFPTRVAQLPTNQSIPLVIYCHHGGRSAQVAAWLRNQGFPHAQSMAGGIDQWAQEIEPGMTRY